MSELTKEQRAEWRRLYDLLMGNEWSEHDVMAYEEAINDAFPLLLDALDQAEQRADLLEAEVNRLSNLEKARRQLSTAYRLGSNRMAIAALTKIEKYEKAGAEPR